VCTTDPQGDDSDTWATLTATFLQRFRITGGRIVRGEEIVQLGVTEAAVEPVALVSENSGEGNDVLLSPTSLRRGIGRRRRSC